MRWSKATKGQLLRGRWHGACWRSRRARCGRRAGWSRVWPAQQLAQPVLKTAPGRHAPCFPNDLERATNASGTRQTDRAALRVDPCKATQGGRPLSRRTARALRTTRLPGSPEPQACAPDIACAPPWLRHLSPGTCCSMLSTRGGSKPRRPSRSRSTSGCAVPLLNTGSCSTSTPRERATEMSRNSLGSYGKEATSEKPRLHDDGVALARRAGAGAASGGGRHLAGGAPLQDWIVIRTRHGAGEGRKGLALFTCHLQWPHHLSTLRPGRRGAAIGAQPFGP